MMVIFLILQGFGRNARENGEEDYKIIVVVCPKFSGTEYGRYVWHSNIAG